MVHTATYGYIKFMLGDAFLCNKAYNKMISLPEPSVSNFNTSVLFYQNLQYDFIWVLRLSFFVVFFSLC